MGEAVTACIRSEDNPADDICTKLMAGGEKCNDIVSSGEKCNDIVSSILYYYDNENEVVLDQV
jgi:hypothetical protein